MKLSDYVRVTRQTAIDSAAKKKADEENALNREIQSEIEKTSTDMAYTVTMVKNSVLHAANHLSTQRLQITIPTYKHSVANEVFEKSLSAYLINEGLTQFSFQVSNPDESWMCSAPKNQRRYVEIIV